MRKLIAGFMTALMALLTASSPVLAATQLGSYPSFLAGSDGTLAAYVVVGAAANPADVVGAVDIASRLAEVGKSTVSQSCSGASGAVDGTEKDTVPLYGQLSSTFPASGVLKSAHFDGLKDSTFSWRGTDYDYREQVDIGSVYMRHSLAVNNVNGSEKMQVQSGDIKYQYVFDDAVSGTGSVDSPNYTYPIDIQLLGKDFSIVGTQSNQVKMLQGSIGTATATTPVVFGDFSVYSDLGYSGASSNSGNWARVIIKDKNGNTVDTLTINQGDNKQSSATGLTVMLTTVRALQDGTVVGADLVIGLTTDGVTKTYTNTADVTSTGTASDRFPGETDWGVEVGLNTLTGATSFGGTAGTIAAGDVIEVVYKPGTTQYLAAGSKISLPNNYGDLGYEGFNTNNFATITIAPLGVTVSAYNVSADTQAFGNLNGIQISSDVAGSIVSSANTAYNKAYILYNYSLGSTKDTVVFIGFYDSTKQKIMVNGTISGTGSAAPSTEYVSKVLNLTNANDQLSYAFKLIYGNAGDNTFYLNVTAGLGKLLDPMFAGTSTTNQSIIINFNNATTVTTSQAPTFRLGASASTSEVDEVNATTEGTVYNAGKKTQDIVDDSGIILTGTDANGAADTIVMEVPFKTLYNTVYFGKQGAGAAAGSISYTSYPSVPLTHAIAKLDSEVTSTEKAANLITVGGPCVNSVTADALGLTYPTCGAASTIPENQGLIKVVDSPYSEGTGKVVVVVAGWEAPNTRAASAVLQQYDTQLSGVTASAVDVTGTVGAPSVTPVTS